MSNKFNQYRDNIFLQNVTMNLCMAKSLAEHRILGISTGYMLNREQIFGCVIIPLTVSKLFLRYSP